MILKMKVKSMNLLKLVIGERNYTKFLFKKIQGYPLNLRNPKTLSEKIQWVKLNCNIENLGSFVDKYEVREYVKEKVGPKYLIPLLGVYNKIDDIDFDILPNKFVIKATHSSGWNIIVSNKKDLVILDTKILINKWLNSSFYKLTGERNYKDIKPRVVIEEMIVDPSGDLKDYKFFCFHGKVKFIQLDGNRHENHKRNLYSPSWDLLDVAYEHGNISGNIRKPHLLKEMVDIAEKLSEDFEFVRVDLYYNSQEIYFGELTFTPGQGFEKFSDIKVDTEFGKYLDVDKINEFKIFKGRKGNLN